MREKMRHVLLLQLPRTGDVVHLALACVVRDRAAPVAGVGRCQARVALNIPFQLTKDQRRASERVLEFMNDSRSGSSWYGGLRLRQDW